MTCVVLYWMEWTWCCVSHVALFLTEYLGWRVVCPVWHYSRLSGWDVVCPV